MRHLIIIIVLAGLSCSGNPNQSSKKTVVTEVSSSENAVKLSFQDLDIEQFAAEIKSNPNAVLMDVRTPEETSEGMIEGAIQLDFFDEEFTKKVSKLDKTKDYYIYCQMGGRSAEAADIMIKNGFTSVHNLEGGYTRWQEEKK